MSPWAPVRMIAAIAMGQRVMPAPGKTPVFDCGITMAALVLHFGLSIINAVILALILAVPPSRSRKGPDRATAPVQPPRWC